MDMTDVEVQAPEQTLSPYRAVQALLEKALEQIGLANAALDAGDIEARTLAVGTTVTIVGVLQDNLDKELGGEIAENLDALYDYMTRRLAGVVLEDDPASLAEVQRLLESIKSAWDGIGAEIEA
jgi:flagellar secretion chaperone FliS